jgi:hypothetical protein
VGSGYWIRYTNIYFFVDYIEGDLREGSDKSMIDQAFLGPWNNWSWHLSVVEEVDI